MTVPALTPWLDDGDVRLYLGDCLEVLRELPADSVDAVVTDPPYGLEFMGREWDRFRVDDPGTARFRGERAAKGAGGAEVQPDDEGRPARIAFGGKRPTTWRCTGCGKRDAFRNDHDCDTRARWVRELIDPYAAPPAMLAFEEWARAWAIEALRVAKPGAHLLAFGGTRTFHRLTCGIEDAGWEIRDSVLHPHELGPLLAWMHGSGFPKSLDVAGAVDRATASPERLAWLDADPDERGDEPAPADPRVAEWAGWGTGLKPGWEPIVVARKPLAGTVAATVLEHGAGALNIDGCRVGGGGGTAGAGRGDRPGVLLRGSVDGALNGPGVPVPGLGRWPANVTLRHLDGCVQVGETSIEGDSREGGQGRRPGGCFGAGGSAANGDPAPNGPLYGAETVPVFDCAPGCPVRLLDEQAGNRGGGFGTNTGRPAGVYGDYAGLDGGVVGYGDAGGPSRFFYTSKASTAERDGSRHPTVKPRDLMRWLVRLVTPAGGVVLDPFAGSGTTGLAARDEGRRAVLVERDEGYARDVAHRLRQLSLFGDAA